MKAQLIMENKKALIVDDEEKARLYLANILAELYPDLDIQLASTPAEAIFLLKKQHIDLVFLDVEMPGMTGLELLEELSKSLKNTSFIFISNYKRAEFIQKALRLNAVDYIDKPVNPTELELAVNKVFASQTPTVEHKDNTSARKFCLITDIDERLVEADEVVYFQSSKRYAIAQFKDGTRRIVRYNIVSLDRLLPSHCFIKVSRRHIINVRYLKNIFKNTKCIVLRYNDSEVKLEKISVDVLNVLIKKYSL